MIIAFTGDAFLAREALNKEAELQGLPPRLIPPEPAVVAQEVSGGLFGPSGAMVDCREILEGEWKPLKELLDKLPPDSLVMLLDPKPTSARSKFYNDKTRVDRRTSPMPEPRELSQWVTNRARVHDLKLNAAMANFLASLVASKSSAENPVAGLEALDQELKKLTLVTPPLDLEKVKAVVALEVPISGFDLVRATTEGKANQAFKVMREIMEQGEDPIRILGALSWQYVRAAKAWALLQDNPLLGEGEAASVLGMHPYAAKQTLLLAKGLSGAVIERALSILVEAEQAAKTGKDMRLALERAVIQLANVRKARGV